MSPNQHKISQRSSARFIPILVMSLLFITSAETRALDGKSPTTLPNSLQELPGFGAVIPRSPKGFEPAADLSSGMVSSEIAKWRRTGAAGREDQIVLRWSPIGMLTSSDGPVEDSFRTGAAHGLGENRERKVPHPSLWPTLRFERAQGQTAMPEDLIRKETVVVNNAAYVLSQYSKDDTPEVHKAFDTIAAALAFEPPATLGEALRPGQRRIPIPGPGNEGLTVCPPEPFRVPDPDSPRADAFDLTVLTRRNPPDLGIEDFSALLYFRSGSRELPENWSEVPQAPSGWIQDDPNLRLARALHFDRNEGMRHRHPMCAFVGARRIKEDQWLWLSLVIPQRIVDQARGDDHIVAVLRETLTTVKQNNAK